MSSRAVIDREVLDHDDDDRPTRRPPPVAELARGVLDRPRRVDAVDREPESDDLSEARTEPITIEPEPYESEAPEPHPDDDFADDEPTIVEPFAYFARDAREALDVRDAPVEQSKESTDERPTDRAMRAATPVTADARPSPATQTRRAVEPRRAEPPPSPRIATADESVNAPIGYPGAAAPPVRVMSPPAAPSATRAAPLAPPVAPVLASQIFRASQRPDERSKVTNFAAGIAALLVVAAAGYLGAMSGKQKAAPEPAQPEPSAAAKIEPPTPVTTAAPHTDPPPAPSPILESPPPPRAREVAPEPAPRRAATEEEPSRPRKTTSEEEPARPRSGETARPSRSRATRPTADEESGGSPETRLPDSSEAPPARPTIDQAALRAAFAEGEAKAKACLGATSPTGTARFSVTFAPTGEAVGAIISGAPFANTLEGQCMTAKFRTLRVPPFTGGEVIVRKSISFL